MGQGDVPVPAHVAADLVLGQAAHGTRTAGPGRAGRRGVFDGALARGILPLLSAAHGMTTTEIMGISTEQTGLHG
ncbi:hypothetical protein [Streptomyces europaeiscabiei]|uniref:hypothetical protein n=1 Tax=Streptomyces europaeiscabiei TaxID=146819 RepID=UPI0038F60CA5